LVGGGGGVKCPTPCKKRGNCPCLGKCPGEYTQERMSGNPCRDGLQLSRSLLFWLLDVGFGPSSVAGLRCLSSSQNSKCATDDVTYRPTSVNVSATSALSARRVASWRYIKAVFTQAVMSRVTCTSPCSVDVSLAQL